MDRWLSVNRIVEKGHQAASARFSEVPYLAGSIELLMPFFKELGRHLAPYYRGMLNVLIRPYTFTGFCQSPFGVTMFSRDCGVKDVSTLNPPAYVTAVRHVGGKPVSGQTHTGPTN